jgi:hypothetical protein
MGVKYWLIEHHDKLLAGIVTLLPLSNWRIMNEQ